jgi:NAD(P)-dependent dehydrogenase (short-subunit alcohol dehydrogenase family)
MGGVFDLGGKVAVVTGAGSGIGEAIARVLAEAAAKVYIAEKNVDAGTAVAEELKREGRGAAFIETDIAIEDSCKACAAVVLEENGGRCDILVNNAGVGSVGTVLTTTAADLDRLYAVNVRGTMFMSQAVLPAMIAARSGSIINLASIGGIVAVRDRFAYCATKFAIVGMTKCMALDHAASQVRVNCICPGRVETPWVQQRLREYPDPAKAYDEMRSTQALGRMGEPREIAAAALYLASDESAFVTGSALIIDGGWSTGK